MATERVGVYRKYHGLVPTDPSGNPLPKKDWPDKRPSSWVARWFGTDGKRYSKSFDTRKEAERFAEAKQQDVRQGKGDPPKRISLREFYREHKVLMKNAIAPSTLHMQLATMALLAEKFGWERHLRRFTTRDIEQYRAWRLDEGRIGKVTANKEVRCLKRLFNLAIDRGYLPEGANPCRKVAALKVGQRRQPFCSPDQFQLVFAKITGLLWQATVTVYYCTALRLKEAINLTWADIDYAAGELHVTSKEADGYVRKWCPKDHELRTIPLPEQAINLLTAWQAVAPVGCPYVFMDTERWAYYRDQMDAKTWTARDLVNNTLRRFQTLCRKAGVPKFTIHDLRRSCITNWARKLPIHVTQQLAGHADINTTRKYYLSVQAEDIRKAKRVQKSLLGELTPAATDPKLTPKGQMRSFPKRKVFQSLPEMPEN
jgi:integrase